jgi:hypothetical protein
MEDSYEDGFDREDQHQHEAPAEPTSAKFQSKQHEVSEKENMIPAASLDVPLDMTDEASTGPLE